MTAGRRRPTRNIPRPPSTATSGRCWTRKAENIDAVVITTPDHFHCVAAYMCMERGKHVYVEKPLARTIWEIRFLMDAARKFKVATQMGNQGYSNDGARIAAEIIWSGRNRQCQGSALLDGPADLAAGDAGAAARRRRRRIRWIGICGWVPRLCVLSVRPTRRSTGGDGSISGVAPLGIWPATYSGR